MTSKGSRGSKGIIMLWKAKSSRPLHVCLNWRTFISQRQWGRGMGIEMSSVWLSCFLKLIFLFFFSVKSVFYKRLTNLCSQHQYLISEHFHHAQKKPVPISSHSPLLPLQSLAPTNLLSVSIGLPIPDISWACKHSTGGLLCLAFFT